jgi:hypothetical protein
LLSVSGAVQFDTAYTGTTAEARLSWNSTDGTLDLGMKGGAVTQQIGQETYYPPVVNKTGGILYEGTLVMINPSQPTFGNRLNVVRSIADGSLPSYVLVGVLTQDIGNNGEGFATWFGYVRQLNTSTLETNLIKPVGETWVSGNILWANPSLNGGYTNVEPSAPNLKVPVAAITNVNGPNVTLLVRPTLTPRLNDLNNVQTSGQTNGDILVYNNTLGYWEYTKTLVGNYTISGDTIQYGDVFQQSASGTSLTTGTNIITTIPVTSGCSANFDYCVTENGGAMRAGTVKVVWNNSTAGYTDYSTTDIINSTSGISFTADISSGNVRLNAVITSGTWSIKVSTNVIF